MSLLALDGEKRLPPLKLESVMPLLQYLHNLPQGNEDRELKPDEDLVACEILVTLNLPHASRQLDDLIIYYAHPDYRRSRSLCVWYGIARAVARCYQDGY